ncbi:MAG: TraR/DksA C4-type zinc finger protein [Acidobacteriota bacterium]|nr:TraR/DksA C4-type zinc finger protein [Acidobacteriota bacterium]
MVTTAYPVESERCAELRRILEERRQDMMVEVHDRMRDVRTESNSATMLGVLDSVETSEADIQDEIEFSLIQMKAETLTKIEEALQRLKIGAYGNCFECGEEVSEQRLRALPFAIRCTVCEEEREQETRKSTAQERSDLAALFADFAS